MTHVKVADCNWTKLDPYAFSSAVTMEESLGPEWRDLLIETYMNCAIEESDEMWQALLHELAMIAMEDLEVSDSDSEDEEDMEDALHHRFLLLEVGATKYLNIWFNWPQYAKAVHFYMGMSVFKGNLG